MNKRVGIACLLVELVSRNGSKVRRELTSRVLLIIVCSPKS